MIGKLALAVATFGLLGVPLGAQAAQFTLGPSVATSDITFTGTGTLVNVRNIPGGIIGISQPPIPKGTAGTALFEGAGPSEVGTYAVGGLGFGPSPLTAGPNMAGQYLVTGQGNPVASFVFISNDLIDVIVGNIFWIFVLNDGVFARTGMKNPAN